MVRELGLKRRETVWSLSTVSLIIEKILFLVREDRDKYVTGVLVVFF